MWFGVLLLIVKSKQRYEKQKGDRRPNEKLVVAAEKVAQTLEELTALENEAGVGDDELALLAEESTRQQRELLTLAKAKRETKCFFFCWSDLFVLF